MPRTKMKTQVAVEPFDPALWSIATALSIAVIYLACLT
ncbi:hypothetical protein ACVWW1_003406 [Bradyrhizobium sp. JR3.5]